MNTTEIAALVQRRDEASKAYYEGESIISDAEFDELTLKLAEAGVEEEVGHGYVPTTNTIQHQYPLLSLEKVREEEAIISWAKNPSIKPPFIVQPKYDGNAIDITYDENGKFLRAATRGNGKVGENVTHTVQALIDAGRIPATVDNSDYEGNTHVLGEAIIVLEDFRALNADQSDREYSNPRNATAGLLRRKKTELAKYLSFFAYDSNHYAEDEVEWLAANGFTTPKDHFYVKADSIEKVMEAIHELEKKKAPVGIFLPLPAEDELDALREMDEEGNFVEEESADASIPAVLTFKSITGFELEDKSVKQFDFEIDGAVIKMAGTRELRESIGNSTSSPRWARAYKYANVMTTTVIREVEWNPTRTGRLVPVAVFDEVVLVGNAKTTRATLHNYLQFTEHGFAAGDTIEITRSNEVIPFIVGKVGDSVEGAVKFSAPTFYPTADFPIHLNATGVDVMMHKDAPKNMVATIVYSLKALDVKGVGPALVNDLLKAGKISNFLDLLKITEEDIIDARKIEVKEGAVSKSSENVVKAVETVFDQPLARWIAAIGMPFIAHTKSPILESRYSSLDELAKAKEGELFALEGFGSEKSASVLKNSAKIQEWADRLRDEHGFVPAPTPKQEVVASKGDVDYNGKKVVVTGSFPTMSRKDVEAWVVAHGGKISSSVSSSTDILVAGEKAGSKLSKATSLGTVTIVPADEFEKNA